jgi:hypothetical protein
MLLSSTRFISTALTLGLLLSPVLGFSAPLFGQELEWLGKGQARLDFAPKFWGWDTRFGSRIGSTGSLIEEAELLSMDLAQDPLGSTTIPWLTDLESNLQKAMEDDGSYRVRLGTSQAILYQSHLTFPFHLEVGVTDWLTIGAMVPLVRTRTEMDFILNGNADNADSGISPNVSAPSDVSDFLGDFGAIVEEGLESFPNDPTLLDAQSYLEALSLAYWQGSVFPVEESAAGGQLQGRLDYFREELETMGLIGVPTTVPLADGYMTEEEFASFMDTPRGMDAAPLEDITIPWSLGDVEITASALVLRGGSDPDSMSEGRHLRYQVGVGALVRLATGTQTFPNRLLTVDPSDAQMDIEGSVFARAELGDRWGGWGHFRFGVQREGEATRRITDPDGVLPNWGRTAPLLWTPGNYLDVELSPWFNLTPEMGFAVRYHLWHKGGDSHALQPIDPELLALLNYPDPALLDLETEETLHEVGFSATYTTRAANQRGEARFPAMIRVIYFHPVMGSGGQTPKGARIQAGITLYRTLWGGRGDPP